MRSTRTSKAVSELRRGETWKQGRRKELLDAAERTIRRLGDAASMDDVAAEAQVSRVVLYRYFGDKGGLYQALAERYVARLMTHLQKALASTDDPRPRVEATIDAYVRFIEKNRKAYDFLMQRAIREGPAAQATVTDFMRTVAEEVHLILEAELSRLGLDPSPAGSWARALVGMVHLSTDWWLEQPGAPRERLVQELLDLLSRGLFAGPSARRG
jgi:AcrR family transcriptional regulator